MTEDEIEDAFSHVTDEELIAEGRKEEQRTIDAIRLGESWATQEHLDRLQRKRVEFERCVTLEKMAAIVKAKADAWADRLLDSIDCVPNARNKRGN